MTEIARIPIIKLYNNLIVSIQMSLSDHVVTQLKDDVTAEIEKEKINGLIIDVSGIGVIDSYISRALRDLGLTAKLMGVNTVIAGMDPLIAMTLVEMGLDIQGVHSVLNLEDAIEQLARLRRKAGSNRKRTRQRRSR